MNGKHSRVHSQSGRCSSPIPAPAQEDAHPLVGVENCVLEETWYPHPDIYISEKEKKRERECVQLNELLAASLSQRLIFHTQFDVHPVRGRN